MIRGTLSATKAATFSIQLPDQNRNGMPVPVGTGFFVSSDGWFMTAAHVVLDSNGQPRSDVGQAWLMKETRPGDRAGAMCQGVELEVVSQRHDFALLKVDFDANSSKDWLRGESAFPSVRVSNRPLEEGEPVYSFGYPLSSAAIARGPSMNVGTVSLRPRVTSAIVSSTFEESRMMMTSQDERVYVLDKALNYGNRGGLLLPLRQGTHMPSVLVSNQSLFRRIT